MAKINLIVRKLLLKNSFYYVFSILTLLYAFIFINIPRKSIYNIEDTTFSGLVENYNITGDKLSVLINSKENLKCNYYFNSENEKNEVENNIKLGSKIKFTGKLSTPLNNTIPNTFNYKKYLYNHGIFYTCRIEKFSFDDSHISFLYRIKNFIIERIDSISGIGDYLKTFILGDKSLLDDETLNNYRKNGVTHLFAISGMHIGLFSGFLLFILKKCKVKENKRYIITVLFIWLYAFITSFTGSVLRAGLLFTLITLNKIYYTEIKTINILILTGILLVLVNPFIIMDLGFIYSYITTFGLIYAGSTIKKHKILGTSLIAFLISLPITINNFYEINFLSILINIFFVPYVSIIVYPLCLITFIFSFLSPIETFFINILESVSSILSNINILRFYSSPMNIFIIIIYYHLFLTLINKKYKICITLLVTLFILNSRSYLLDNNYYVDFLDVNQGDSILIRSPKNKEIILVDTGGQGFFKTDRWKEKKEYHISDNTITYLHSLGLSRIDYMFLTHGDADHLGEALHIIDNIDVKNVLLNDGEYNYAENLIIDSGINIVKKYSGSLNLKVLKTNIENDENSNSQIIYLCIHDKNILLMGDAPKKKEIEILNKYNLPSIDIIKLGHHGSKTSSDEVFLKAINVKEAIISSGRNNKFNHPHKETLDTLEKLKIKYYNTQDSGTIEYRISNYKTTINLYKP